MVRSGGVVGVPTDTVYGLGVDPFNEEAVARLYELKGRPPARPIGVLVGSMDQARVIGDLSEAADVLAVEHWPGGLTLVVTARVVLPDWVGDRHKRTVGLRMPDHPVALELLQATGPLSVTSANLSGKPDTTSDAEAKVLFGDAVYYVAGVSPGGQPSTVVDMTGVHPVVLREGPVDVTN